MVTIWKRQGTAALMLLALLIGSTVALVGGAAPASAQAFSIISGRVLADTNLNRLVDPSDQPLVAVEVRLLDPAGSPVAVTGTDAQGRYSFDSVTPGGSYLITTVPPFATVPEKVEPGPGATAAGFNAIFIRNLRAGASYPENNFLQRQFQVVSPVTPETPNTISGRVINDLNGNGTPDAGEPGLGNAVLTLLNAAGVVLATTTSAPTGEFTFAGVPSGDLFLTHTPPAGYAATNAIPGVGATRSDASTLRLTTAAGVTLYGGQLFLDRATNAVPSPGPGPGPGPSPGTQPGPNQIEGFVINDVNGNRLADRSDMPLAGVAMALKDASGVLLATSATDVAGRFAFSGLATGVYLVSKTDPPGFVAEEVYPGTDAVKIDEGTVRISMISGSTSYNGTLFLDQQGNIPSAGPNVIAGSVLNDANGNGVLDAGEGPLANATVTLRDASNQPIAAAVTSITGAFAFGGLANGTYTLQETDLPGFISTAAIPGTGGQVIDPNTIRVTTIDGVVTYAGNLFLDRQAAIAAPGANTISGLVVNDLNGNHVPDTGEPPLAGAVLTLQNSAGQIAGTATTGADGAFSFANLADGTYAIIQLPPVGFAGTAAVPGVGAQVLAATVIQVTTQAGLTNYAGQLFLDQSGGNAPPPVPTILSINPPSGGPGSTVVISGRGFGSGAVQVMFRTTPATVLNSSSLLNTLVALVPNLPPGPAPVTLVNSAGASPAGNFVVTAPGARSALGTLFLPAFNELGTQSGQAQVGPTMQVVIAQSLSYAQNQAVGGNVAGAMASLRSLLARIGRSPEDLVSSVAKAALDNQMNLLIGQLQAQPG